MYYSNAPPKVRLEISFQIITYFGGNFHKKEQFENYKGITYSKLFAKKAM
jgi:hypothetical protein